jgi:hypothetical protein
MDRRKLATFFWLRSLGMVPRRSVTTSSVFGKGVVVGEGIGPDDHLLDEHDLMRRRIRCKRAAA